MIDLFVGIRATRSYLRGAGPVYRAWPCFVYAGQMYPEACADECDNLGSMRYAVGVSTPMHATASSFRSAWRARLGTAASVALALTPVGLVGCSSYRAPTMEVISARTVERTADGAVVEFTVKASHDNAKPLPLREATYSLELDGQTVFSGVRSAEATLPRGGSQQIVLPVAIKSGSLASSATTGRYRLLGSLTYITPGAFAELLFDSGVARPTVPFAGEGSIELPGQP